jgi:hypothetical protein
MVFKRFSSVSRLVLLIPSLSLSLALVLPLAFCGCSLFPSDKPDLPLATETETGNVEESPEKPEKDSKGFSLVGFLFGKKDRDNAKAEKDRAPLSPTPQKVTVGKVHLVHEDARFVLIQSTRLATLPAAAEMMTYSPEGRPTGRLRISPERKGAFLVADILSGNPKVDDAVVLYGIQGPDGKLITDPNPEAFEVLE